MVGVLERWAQHRAADDADFETADDNVVWWGSRAIWLLARGDKATQTKFLAAGAKQVLESIQSDLGASEQDKNMASHALYFLQLDPSADLVNRLHPYWAMTSEEIQETEDTLSEEGL